MQSGRPRPCARLALALALALAGCTPAAAFAESGFKRDTTPLPADVTGGGSTHSVVQASGSGGAALRMILGLAIVLAIIFGLYKLLKRSARKTDGAIRTYGQMAVVASTPLAQSRGLHLVQVGDELVLVGSSEQAVTPIRVYTAEEARRLGFDTRDVLPPMLPGSTGSDGRSGFGAALVEGLRKMTAR